MIKINLLDSVTERQSGAVMAVERRIANPMSRLLIMAVTVGVLLVLTCVGDVVLSQRAKAQAEQQLAEQQKIAADLAAVTAEMKDLDQKTENIKKRIKTIKDLRDSQAGPSAVLEAMRERIAMTPGLYLEGVEQKGELLTITGSSPNEQAVTQFGRSLEFSAGLFSNLNIEIQRKDAPNQAAASTEPGAPEAPKLQIVGFTIRCAYTPSKGSASQNSSPTTASAAPAGAPPIAPAAVAPPAAQVAKN